MITQYIEGFLNGCRGRDRTSTRQLAVAQSSVVDPGRFLHYCKNGSILSLSCYPHPRDKGACLPKISSPHNLKNQYDANLTIGFI